MALLGRASGNTLQFSNNCFNKFSSNCMRLKFHRNIPASFALCSQAIHDTQSLSTAPAPQKNKYVSYEELVNHRRDQARRSILVQVQSVNSSKELHNYCSQYGYVQEMHHYTTANSVNFILVEFKSLGDIDTIRSVSTFAGDQSLPVISDMLWFRASLSKPKSPPTPRSMPLIVQDVVPTSTMITTWMLESKSVSEQMMTLISSAQLTDTDTRLRFLTARQVEMALSGIFPYTSVWPFGSSVNGFGKTGCDLDLVLKLQPDQENTDARLVYHTKVAAHDDRSHAQKVMETIASLMQQFLPGVNNMRRILRARVPILKYNQTFTGLECDLSMTNTIGIYMSELLYLFGELDPRVRPLIVTVRTWAKSVKLTDTTPGHWITNFSLTLLVLFYLQQKSVLPSLKYLAQHARKSDIRIADDVNCTFLRDISRLPPPASMNEDSLETLLTDFFIFYSSFDYATRAICLYEGRTIPKPDESTVFVNNPLERGLNVTKNLNIQETERMRVEMRNAAWILESASDEKTNQWGLLRLFKPQTTQDVPANFTYGNRMLEVETLFRKSHSKETGDQNGTIASTVRSPSREDATNVARKIIDTGADPTNRSSFGTTDMKSKSTNIISKTKPNGDRQGLGSSKFRDGRRQQWRR